jgi:Leucine-rich repeat (LRR) protein
MTSGDAVVDWGDYDVDKVFDGNDNITHTYSDASSKTVNVYIRGGYEDVTWLLINDNNIDSVVDVSNLTNLTRLYLYSNNLSTTPDVNNLTNLQRLWLQNNNLSTTPDVNNLTSLIILSLQSNNLTTTPDVNNLTNLQRLFLFNNNLTTIPDVSNLTSLELLYLYDNNLDTITDQTLPGDDWDDIDYRIQDNSGLSAASISQLLIDLDEGDGSTEAENGSLNISGCNGGTLLYNDLTTAGKAAYDNLETKGWTITTDD